MGKYNFFKDAKGGSGAVDDKKKKGKFRESFGGEDQDEKAMRMQKESQERSKKKKGKFSKIMNLFD